MKATGDHYAGEFPRQLAPAVSQARHIYEVSKATKSDLFRDLLPLLNYGRITLPRNDRLIPPNPTNRPKCSAKPFFRRDFCCPVNALQIRTVEDQSDSSPMIALSAASGGPAGDAENARRHCEPGRG